MDGQTGATHVHMYTNVHEHVRMCVDISSTYLCVLVCVLASSPHNCVLLQVRTDGRTCIRHTSVSTILLQMLQVAQAPVHDNACCGYTVEAKKFEYDHPVAPTPRKEGKNSGIHPTSIFQVFGAHSMMLERDGLLPFSQTHDEPLARWPVSAQGEAQAELSDVASVVQAPGGDAYSSQLHVADEVKGYLLKPRSKSIS